MKYSLSYNLQGNYTPLHWAASYGHHTVAVELMRRGADINMKADGGATPLHFATANGLSTIVEKMVASGADLSVKVVGHYTTVCEWEHMSVCVVCVYLYVCLRLSVSACDYMQ